MKCRQCAHYGAYKRINEEPYGCINYVGFPCLTCKRFRWENDNFAPVINYDHIRCEDTDHHG
jgi:hypothetical protein